MQKELYSEHELAALAKKLREKANKTQSEIARELKVGRAAVHLAEDPAQSLTKLRIRIIEACSENRVDGPFYRVREL